MVDVARREELHDRLGPGQCERDRERAAVRRPEHHEPPAAPAVDVVHLVPRGAMELRESSRDEPTHRVCDEVHRLARAEHLHLGVQPSRALVDVVAPVERERPHVPAGVELEEHRDVGHAVEPGWSDVDSGPRRLAGGCQLEVADPPGEKAHEVDPDPVDVTLPVDRVELRPHDPREHEDLAQLRPPSSAGRREACALERFRPQFPLEDVRLAAVERQQRAADAVEVATVERGLKRVDPGCLGRAHSTPPRRASATAAGDRCAAASAGGTGVISPLLRSSLLRASFLDACAVKVVTARRRSASGRRP